MKFKIKIIYFILALLLSPIPFSWCEVYQTTHVPWSGYWWPFNRGGLVTGSDYNGEPSPVCKYDYATQGRYLGDGYYYGLNYFYKKNALSWEGLCFSWAASSALEEEPEDIGAYGNEVFYVGDKKALLTAAYHKVLYMSYSVQTPDLFHEILYTFIANEQEIVVIDLHTGGEVWNFPIFKFETNYETDGDTRHYTTTVFYPLNNVAPDFVGSIIDSKTYYYYFTLGSNGEIVECGWEKDSYEDYPVKAYQLFSASSENNDIKLDIVKKIVASTDDSFEPNDSGESAKSVSNGTYRLICQDNDFYKIDLEKGDGATVEFNCDEEYSLNFDLYNPAGEIVMQGTVPGKISLDESVERGQYLICVYSMEEESIPYELTMDYRMSYLGILPVDFLGSWVNGIALLNTDDFEDGIGRLIISSVDQDGSIQKSFTENASENKIAGALEYQMGLISTDNGYIRIDSEKALKGLQVVTTGSERMIGGNLVQSSNLFSNKVCFPVIGSEFQLTTVFGLINIGTEVESVNVKSFDVNGDIFLEYTFEIAPGEKIEDGNFDVITKQTDAVSFATQSGRKSLLGYISMESTKFNAKGMTLFSAGLEEQTDRTVIAPNVAVDSVWNTIVAVINVGEAETTVACKAYDVDGMELGFKSVGLKPNQSLFGLLGSIFTGIEEKNVSSVVFQADEGGVLSGFSILFSATNDRIVGAPLSPKIRGSIFIPHVAESSIWKTGMVVMNPEEVEQKLLFNLFDSEGGLIESKIRAMAPFESYRTTLGKFFDNVSAGSHVSIVADGDGIQEQGICGYYSIGRSDGIAIMGDIIQ